METTADKITPYGNKLFEVASGGQIRGIANSYANARNGVFIAIKPRCIYCHRCKVMGVNETLKEAI